MAVAGNISIAVNQLSLDLYRVLADKNGDNIFFSPLSISTCLGMLLEGTKGDSEKELFKGLKYQSCCSDPSQVHVQFRKLFEESLKNDPSLPYSLFLANRLLIEAVGDSNAIAKYKQALITNYKATVEDVNFAKDGQKIKNEVNNWVAEQTRGMIKTVFDEAPSADTKAILLNAIYFKGSWVKKFDVKDTKKAPFYNSGVEANAVQVDFMTRRRKGYNYIERELAGQQVQIIELPYDGEVSMYIVLPKKNDGLADLSSKLNYEELKQASENLFLESEVTVIMPKFKFETKVVLNNALSKLGVQKIFAREADLSGINGQKNLFVSEVLHKAVINVDEEGTTAAAVTSVGIMLMSMPMQITFKADHPFLFFIKDKKTDIILFMGRVDKL
jgi:serpin B